MAEGHHAATNAALKDVILKVRETQARANEQPAATRRTTQQSARAQKQSENAVSRPAIKLSKARLNNYNVRLNI